MIAEQPNVSLRLASQPENVALVREMLTGVAEATRLDPNDLNDIRTAATEACNNVVLHAYGGEEGSLEVEVFISTSAIEVVVRDHGSGIQPRIRTSDDDALGIGISIIQALAQRVEFMDVAGGGTEVRMEFDTPGTRAIPPAKDDGFELPALGSDGSSATTAVAIAPSDLARTVLPRVLSVLAARAHFTTDRISDAQLVADALVPQRGESTGADRLAVSVTVEPRTLQLHIGPLDSGSARRLIAESAIDGLGPVIERLVDDHQVATVGASEVLALRLVDKR